VNAKFQNRLPPENINVSKTNPLLELIALFIGFLLVVAGVTLVLYLAGGVLARQMPFAWEDKLAALVFDQKKADATIDTRSAALQKIADRLAQGLELPAGLHFTVRYVDDATVNAFATLGGRIFVHKGLINRLSSENALAMVIAHEMGHVLHRDPADALGGRLAIALVLNVFSSAIGTDALEGMIGTTSNLTLLSFSREAEHQADALGIALVARLYGHLGGAQQVFNELAAYEGKNALLAAPELLSTHPDSLRRAAFVTQESERLGLSATGALTELPAALRPGKE